MVVVVVKWIMAFLAPPSRTAGFIGTSKAGDDRTARAFGEVVLDVDQIRESWALLSTNTFVK